jgi:hypothetical protein
MSSAAAAYPCVRASGKTCMCSPQCMHIAAMATLNKMSDEEDLNTNTSSLPSPAEARAQSLAVATGRASAAIDTFIKERIKGGHLDGDALLAAFGLPVGAKDPRVEHVLRKYKPYGARLVSCHEHGCGKASYGDDCGCPDDNAIAFAW